MTRPLHQVLADIDALLAKRIADDSQSKWRTSYTDYSDALHAAYPQLREAAQDREQWRAKYEACKMEAQIHAQEARTANATIAEIYQACTGATGEPGNWHGAEPVKQTIERMREALEAWKDLSGWADGGWNLPSEGTEALERIMKRAISTINSLTAQLAEAEKDAARYRKARTLPLVLDHSRIAPPRPDKFDKLIDAAIAGERHE